MKEFQKWWNAYKDGRNPWTKAFTMCTVDHSLQPDARLMQLLEIKENSLVFCTNSKGKKAKDFEFNPKVALVFQWEPIRMQIRITGKVEKLSTEDSVIIFDRNFNELERYCHTGEFSDGCGYQQSDVIENLESWEKWKEQKEKRESSHMPCFWSAYIIIPDSIEMLNVNLGMRDKYILTDEGEWEKQKLAF